MEREWEGWDEELRCESGVEAEEERKRRWREDHVAHAFIAALSPKCERRTGQ